MEDEQILDASAIDNLDDYELTGELDENLETPDQNDSQSEESQQEYFQNNEGHTEDSEEYEDQDDFTLEVLRLKGIQDPTKIKFEDESGAIVERSWNDLTDSERLNILANEEDPERDLEDDEIILINQIRANNLTPQQYIQAVQQHAAQTALQNYQQSLQPTYEIDKLNDDELFILDLLEKVGEENITDEELQEALDQAKTNEVLFEKQIEGLRTTYKNLEDQQKYNAEQARVAQAEAQYQNFSNSVLNEIGSFNYLANQEIELSTDDKNDIANYMLTRRETGISDFYSDIQDPATATLAAFWLLRGPEVLNEMENQIRAAYQRGFDMGKADKSNRFQSQTPYVVVQNPVTNSKNVDSQSAFGLEDDSYLH